MTRTEFTTAYREARLNLKFMAASAWTLHMGKPISKEQRRDAEARWIARVNDPRVAPAYRAVVDSLHLPGSIASAAVFDFIHCGGGRKDWYLRMARDSRARRAA